MEMKRNVISLGWNCGPSVMTVDKGLRPRKADGYKTCPFDYMITNYDGLVECIRDDFKYFCDTDYLKIVEFPHVFNALNFNGHKIIVNTKYNFVFNHESGGHGELWKSENWPCQDFFEKDNFREFCNRYNRRIENFRNYVNSENGVTFYISKVNNSKETNVELDKAFRTTYPNADIDFFFMEETYHQHFNEGLYLMHKIIPELAAQK